MQRPMTVKQWINNHYYFSTVDNNMYGGGSKITHNITGKFGAVQGNGGDLKMGLPLQYLFGSDENMYHQPLRLSVMIQAPIARVSEIIARNEGMKTLLENEWIYLMMMDPTSKNEIFHYKNLLNGKLPHLKIAVRWLKVNPRYFSFTIPTLLRIMKNQQLLLLIFLTMNKL